MGNFVATSGDFLVAADSDCVTAPLTKARVDYWGYFNDNTRD